MDGTEAPESWPVCLQVLHSWTDTHQNQLTHFKAVREGMTVQGWMGAQGNETLWCTERARNKYLNIAKSKFSLTVQSFEWRQSIQSC